MLVKLLQAHRYGGPPTSGRFGAQAKQSYGRDRVLDVPDEYFERALEPYGFAVPVDVAAEAAGEAAAAVDKLKLAELREVAEQFEIDLEKIDGSGTGGRVVKADLVAALIEQVNTEDLVAAVEELTEE